MKLLFDDALLTTKVVVDDLPSDVFADDQEDMVMAMVRKFCKDPDDIQKFLISNILPILPDEIVYEQLPKIAPPYPRMWFEWRLLWDGNLNLITGDDAPIGEAYYMGCYIETQEIPQGWTYDILLFEKHIATEDPQIPIVTPLNIVVRFRVPAEGKIQGDLELEQISRQGTDPNLETNDWIRDYYISPVLFGIGLLHCKNVLTEIRGGRKMGVKRQRRYTTRHHVLNVIPARKIKTTRFERDSHNKLSLHFRRGHFKTYSQEAPLFGRIVGTFWWDAHTAGNAEIGVVTKDYNVLPEQDDRKK